jgi:hypothetical protein
VEEKMRALRLRLASRRSVLKWSAVLDCILMSGLDLISHSPLTRRLTLGLRSKIVAWPKTGSTLTKSSDQAYGHLYRLRKRTSG